MFNGLNNISDHYDLKHVRSNIQPSVLKSLLYIKEYVCVCVYIYILIQNNLVT